LAISLLRDGLTIFFERLRHNLSLELFLKVHLLQASVFFFELFHARHHGNIHAAELSPPFVKGRAADAQLTTNVWNADASLNALDRVHNLAVTEFRSLHIEHLPLEKILLLTPLVLGDDYPDPQTVAEFLMRTVPQGIKSSTIRRKVSSISAIHRLSSLEDPTKHSEVMITQRKIY
jgi:hypothetical protein